ncbi:phage protein NinX family protein [Caballeronia sp. ATUFL_F1_KS4A]|uniref:phage protein NinX family protein n=1 Tax=Caballeronia sp. ATUFL_F1_KS4A TaxID=2921768 RepID=UPI002027AABD|nr:phage protein NinX family protein [Caballeronia sp. ATUFL_F1_KS4A]
MNVSELSGAQLDYWVAKAEGMDAEVKRACGMEWCQVDVQSVGLIHYQPSDDWHIAAPIAERQRYVTYPRMRAGGKVEWLAESQLNPEFHGIMVDESPKVAICRLRVAEVFGLEVAD